MGRPPFIFRTKGKVYEIASLLRLLSDAIGTKFGVTKYEIFRGKRVIYAVSSVNFLSLPIYTIFSR